MPHARGCLSDCRLRSCSSDTDLNSHKAALWLFVPVLLPSQLCAAHSDGLCLLAATRSALEAHHDCVLAVQDRFSHPSKVVPAWSACVCPVVLEGDQFSELELGWNLHKGALCRREFSWARDLGVESFGWISQDSSERRKISLSLEKKRRTSSFSSLFHDKNQQF